MAAKKIVKNTKSWHKKEIYKDQPENIYNNNTVNNTHKNTLFVYKDKSTTRVTYDISSDEYITVYMNN